MNLVVNPCDLRQEKLVNQFLAFGSVEEKYQFLLDLGRKQPKLSPQEKNEGTRVSGCQANTYISIRQELGKIIFTFDSDARISAGLGALLSLVYSGETKESILASPPHFLQKIGLFQTISSSRAHGVLSMYATVMRFLSESGI